MHDITEVYEMVTRQKPAEPGALERQQKRQVRAARSRKFGGYAVAAAVGLVAVVAVILATRGEQGETTPAGEPTIAPGAATGPFFLDLQLDPPRSQGQSWAGERTPLAENLSGGYAYVASPDGTRLAYGSAPSGGCDLRGVMTVANIDGTDARTIESPEGLNICGARWSPDGTKLVYQERNGADPNDVGNLFIQDLDTGQRTQITDLELSKASWWFLSPSFSPDGQDVLFHMPRDSSETTKWDVWSVSVTGGERTLVLRNASFPMLSPYALEGPEGLGIQFVSPMTDDFAGHSIMTARPIPSSDIRSTLVEANDSIWWPTLSPDGRWIAYHDGGSIYVVDVANLDAGTAGEFSKVAEGETAEWLDNDTLIVAP